MGKMIEVDEDLYNQNAKLRATIAKIASNPKNAAALEAMQKEIEPNITTPFLDAEKARNAPIEALSKDIADLRKSLEEKDAKEQEERQKGLLNAKWEAGRQWMLEQGFTPEGIKKIEDEIMAPKGIVDHRDAAKIWNADHPPAPPAMPGGTGAWNFLDPQPDDKNENIKQLLASKGENNLVADRMANEALNEFRQQVAQSSGRR